jgi:hypothetical protein
MQRVVTRFHASGTTAKETGEKVAFNLFILRNVPPSISNNQMRELFSKYGPHRGWQRTIETDTGFAQSTGHVWMTLRGGMRLKQDAEKKFFFGRQLVVIPGNAPTDRNGRWQEALDSFVSRNVADQQA